MYEGLVTNASITTDAPEVVASDQGFKACANFCVSKVLAQFHLVVDVMNIHTLWDEVYTTHRLIDRAIPIP